MEFAVIAPTKLLPKYAAGRKVQFCLAHLCDRVEYLKFYQERVAARDTVILDNGAYEGELMTFDELAQVAFELQPTVLVLPDVLGDAKMTKYLHSGFRSYWHANMLTYERDSEWRPTFMSVLQGGDIWELIEQYKNVPDGEWVGFPRKMAKLVDIGRYALAARLKQIGLWDNTRRHHALGMVEGSIEELRNVAKEGFHSCDSSHPVWRGIDEKEDFNVDWESGGSPYSHIVANLQKVDQACKGEK